MVLLGNQGDTIMENQEFTYLVETGIYWGRLNTLPTPNTCLLQGTIG